MGRKRRSKASSKPSYNSFAKHTVASGKVFWQVTATNTAAALPLHPSSVPRLTDLANAFQLYRFTSLKIEVLPTFRAATSIGAAEMYYVGYYNDVVDSLPNSTQAGSELAYSIVRPMGHVFDIANSSAIQALSVASVFKVPRSFLLKDTALKWFKANLGTPDSWDELQGNIVYRAENSVQVGMMIWYTVEFAGPLPFNSTPQAFSERLQQIERNRALLDLYKRYMAGQLKLPDGVPRLFEELVKVDRAAEYGSSSKLALVKPQ